MSHSAAVLSVLCALPTGETSSSWPERISESPDCLIVTKIHSPQGRVATVGVLDTRLHLYIYVPPGTERFTLSVFDQTDNGEPGSAATPSRFVLYAPNGAEASTLNQARVARWADYPVEVAGRVGVWRLSVTGPEDAPAPPGGGRAPKAENAFRVRTMGAVDLYMKLDAVARVRGARFGAPRFGGSSTHRFLLQMPRTTAALRLNLLHTVRAMPLAGVLLSSQDQVPSVKRESLTGDDRLSGGITLSTLDVTAGDRKVLRGLWSLTLPSLSGTDFYGLGIDYPVRAFFLSPNAVPLMPTPTPTPVRVTGGAASIRVVTPGRDANLPLLLETNADGTVLLPLDFYPGTDTMISASRSFLYEPDTTIIRPREPLTLAPRRIVAPLSGWFGGDTHCHTTYYDGSDTPAQMVAAAQAQGLDWLCVTEHAHSEWLGRTERAAREAQSATTNSLLVIPGMEYTGPRFHANIFGGTVRSPEGSRLSDIVVAAQKTGASPPMVALNHPTIGTTAAGELRDAAHKPSLIELWNSSEPDATRLWWEMLNAGHRIYAEAGSDSHHRHNAPPGYRRTYVHLGTKPLTNANVLAALQSGRSFISRGALLDLTIAGKRPGDTVSPGAGELPFRMDVRSSFPVQRVDIVANGVVVISLPANGRMAAVLTASLKTRTPGWYVAQAWGTDEKLPLAMTNPVWVASPDNDAPEKNESGSTEKKP